MGETNQQPSSDSELRFSHPGNEVACLCDQRSVSGALSTCKHGLFHQVNSRMDLWSQGTITSF